MTNPSEQSIEELLDNYNRLRSEALTSKDNVALRKVHIKTVKALQKLVDKATRESREATLKWARQQFRDYGVTEGADRVMERLNEGLSNKEKQE